MDRTSVESLRLLTERFSEEVNDLSRILKELTTNGSGYLYDLKTVVGTDSELGVTISKLGGAVMNASSNAITSLNKITNILVGICNKHESLQEEAEVDYTARISEIEAISFKNVG